MLSYKVSDLFHDIFADDTNVLFPHRLLDELFQKLIATTKLTLVAEYSKCYNLSEPVLPYLVSFHCKPILKQSEAEF